MEKPVECFCKQKGCKISMAVKEVFLRKKAMKLLGFSLTDYSKTEVVQPATILTLVIIKETMAGQGLNRKSELPWL